MPLIDDHKFWGERNPEDFLSFLTHLKPNSALAQVNLLPTHVFEGHI
jgi:hypothetical protein